MEQAESNLDLIRTFYDAYDSGDREAIAQLISPQIAGYISDFLPWGGALSGRTELQEAAQRFQTYAADTFEIEDIFEAGNEVVAIGKRSGYFHSNGEAYSARAVESWRIEDHVIVSFTSHVESIPPLSNLG